ncbi:MAG: helix-turn-helix domain-containing protein, partial [Hamadaea sp.]|nr:helix-turn-helix domain-containing protein [Hamadaea sp.]
MEIAAARSSGLQYAPAEGADRRTRDRVLELLGLGGATAAQLGDALGLKPAAIRRHLDALVCDGLVTGRDQPAKGRGRPAKIFSLTREGREGLGGHTYDDLAAAALRWIAAQNGEKGVAEFARAQVAQLEARCREAMTSAGDDPLARAEALAQALTAEGYAASASVIASGGQLCQHHCPVAHVA